MIHASMIVMGIATILQTLRYGRIGSGYLCPERLGPAYIPASILAIKTGGLPLLAGMTLVSGLLGVVLSRLMSRLRPFFPAEVTGTIGEVAVSVGDVITEGDVIAVIEIGGL